MRQLPRCRFRMRLHIITYGCSFVQLEDTCAAMDKTDYWTVFQLISVWIGLCNMNTGIVVVFLCDRLFHTGNRNFHFYNIECFLWTDALSQGWMHYLCIRYARLSMVSVGTHDSLWCYLIGLQISIKSQKIVTHASYRISWGCKLFIKRHYKIN